MAHQDRGSSFNPRGMHAAVAALHAVVHSSRALHRPAEGGDPVAPLAAGGPGFGEDRFRGSGPETDRQETRSYPDTAAIIAASAAGASARDGPWLYNSRPWSPSG